jgi:hypothetical protein
MSDTMNDTPANGDAARLVACRSCGNRVARSARRCPACGTREPTSAGAEPETAPADDVPARPPRSGRAHVLGLVLAALVGAAAAGVVAYIMQPAPPPVPAPAAQPPGIPAPTVAPEPPRPAPAPAPPVPVPSRSRGRTDWLFFFKPGDRLARMSDETPVGLVIRIEKTHTFADGTTGPAYLVQIPEGGQRFIDADELERGARLQ